VFPPVEVTWELPATGFSALKLENPTLVSTPEELTIEGDIHNTGKASQDVPRLRLALRDASQRELQVKIIDPPLSELRPDAVAHFRTSFQRPDNAATQVVVTFYVVTIGHP
jgi:Protein of unknown function (DUF3426)